MTTSSASLFDPTGPPSVRYVVASVHDGLATLDPNSVSCVITSVPYWGRRRYTDRDDEIGTGDLDRYLGELGEVFDALVPVLRDDAVVWVNVGDSAAGSGGSGGDYSPSGSRAGQRPYRQGRSGIQAGQWCSAPHRLVHILQDRGWLLRSEVIWDKGRRRREPLAHVRRPGESHEYVFMLTRSKSYGFNHEKLTETGSVWHIAPERSRTGHVAPMPVELARRCLEVCPGPGLVLDPFAGSGAVLAAASGLGRACVGIDFDPTALVSAQVRMSELEVDIDVDMYATAPT
jgi:site-specific DNA-methyltransferase (cytosine-N4-specific)